MLSFYRPCFRYRSNSIVDMLFMLLLVGTYTLNIQTINKSPSFFFHPFHEEISDVACEKFIHAIDIFSVVFNCLNSFGLACGHIAFVIVKSKWL